MRNVNLTLCALALSVVSSTSFAAYDGDVTFNGELIDETCVVAPESKNIVVNLPTLSVKNLAAAGSEAGSKDFEIKATDCPTEITKVAAHFEAINSSGANPTTGNLVNTAETDPAGNVEVRLYNIDDSSQIRVGSTGKSVDVETDGTVSLHYAGGYYATAATTAGPVLAKVQYVLAYN